jgi:DNA polymerase-3 subunit alpha
LKDGQTDIFGMMAEGGNTDSGDLKLKKVPVTQSSQKFAHEKEYLGLYISGHPLQGLKEYIHSKGRLIGTLNEKDHDKKIKVTGLVSHIRKVLTKSGKYMSFGEIEDTTARVPFVLFPKAYDQFGQIVEDDKVFSMEGRLDKRGGEFQVVVDGVAPLSLENMISSAQEKGFFDSTEHIIGVPSLKKDVPEEVVGEENAEVVQNVLPQEEIPPYVIELAADASPELMQKLKTLLEAHPGENPVEIHIKSNKTLKRIKVPFTVNTNEALQAKLKNLLAA